MATEGDSTGGAASGAALLSSAIGAGGQIGGALLSQPSNSSANRVNIHSDPFLNPFMIGAAEDAFGLIGRSDPSREVSPIDAVIGRINSLPIIDKKKRRALRAIREMLESGVTSPFDPSFSRGEGPKKQGVPRIDALAGALKFLGMTLDDFEQTLVADQKFKAELPERIEKASLFNEQIQGNRRDASLASSQLLGDAARFSQTGVPQSQFQTDTLGRINRGIDDQEEQFLLRSQFGGFQPGAGIEGFGRARTDAPLTAMEQALASAAGLTANLGAGLEFAQQSAGQISGANLGAAGIASQQAQAANAIRARADGIARGNLGQGVADGAAAFGTGLANAGAAAPAAQTNQLFAPSQNSVGPNDFGNIRF